MQQEALPEVPCSHTGRLEILDYSQHGKHLIGIGFDSRPEREVVHYGFYVPPEVAVIVQGTYQECRYVILVLVKIAAAQLVHKALVETRLDREAVVFRTRILAPVVHAGLVGRDVIVVLQFVYGDVLAFFRTVRVRTVIQHGILLQLRTDFLLQTLNRKLQELDGQNLKRRHLLCLLKFESLLYHRIVSSSS